MLNESSGHAHETGSTGMRVKRAAPKIEKITLWQVTIYLGLFGANLFVNAAHLGQLPVLIHQSMAH